MAEIQRREQQYMQTRQEKEKLFQSAVDSYEKAELSAALTKLERVLELDRKALVLSRVLAIGMACFFLALTLHFFRRREPDSIR